VLLSLFIILNLLSTYIYPNGINNSVYNPNWIIGQKQDFSMAFLPTLILGPITMKKRKDKFFYVFIVIAMLFQLIEKFTLGTIISFMVFALLAIYFKFGKVDPKKLLKYYFYGFALLLLLAFVFTDNSLFVFFSKLQAGEFSKFDTLSVRFLLWRDAWDIFAGSYLFGAGAISESRYYLFQYAGQYYPNFHNMIFDLLATCGVMGFAIYLYFNKNIIKSSVLRSHYYYNYIICGVFAVNVLWLVEAVYSPLLCIPLFSCSVLLNSERRLAKNEK